MSSIIESLREKQRQVQQLRSEEERRRGQEAQLLKQLTEFGVEDLKGGLKLLEEYQSELSRIDSDLKAMSQKLDEVLSTARSQA